MARVVFRLYAELNEVLPGERRQRPFEIELPAGQPLGEALRELGVELGDVDLALVNGAPAPLSRPLEQGDRVAAYPVFESFDLAALVSRPLRETRFAVDPGLARLGLALRALGFDARTEREPGRILLSRERAPEEATHAIRVRERLWSRQLVEVVGRVQLESLCGLARRCARCNAPVVEERCPACGRSSRPALRRRALERLRSFDAGGRDADAVRC